MASRSQGGMSSVSRDVIGAVRVWGHDVTRVVRVTAGAFSLERESAMVANASDHGKRVANDEMVAGRRVDTASGIATRPGRRFF